jgi:hydroxymethylbilane synthase
VSQPLRIATRASRLAKWQTQHVERLLDELKAGLATRVVEITTTGDVLTDVPLSSVSGSAFFTKEIENALLAGEVDVAVHSLKDLAAQDVPGLTVVAVLEREDPRDALLSATGTPLTGLEPGARVGTSSVRRKALLASLRPDVELLELRGNVPTRVRKLDEGEYDAIVLAAAGLNRLGMGERISEHLDPEHFVPAAGQGAIALQVRAGDTATAELVARLQHEETRSRVDAERAFLSELEVGCQSPVGVHARRDGDRLEVHAVIASLDGETRLEARREGPALGARELGQELANDMRRKGGVELIHSARSPRTNP